MKVLSAGHNWLAVLSPVVEVPGKPNALSRPSMLMVPPSPLLSWPSPSGPGSLSSEGSANGGVEGFTEHASRARSLLYGSNWVKSTPASDRHEALSANKRSLLSSTTEPKEEESCNENMSTSVVEESGFHESASEGTSESGKKLPKSQSPIAMGPLWTTCCAKGTRRTQTKGAIRRGEER